MKVNSHEAIIYIYDHPSKWFIRMPTISPTIDVETGLKFSKYPSKYDRQNSKVVTQSSNLDNLSVTLKVQFQNGFVPGNQNKKNDSYSDVSVASVSPEPSKHFGYTHCVQIVISIIYTVMYLKHSSYLK